MKARELDSAPIYLKHNESLVQNRPDPSPMPLHIKEFLTCFLGRSLFDTLFVDVRCFLDDTLPLYAVNCPRNNKYVLYE